MSKYRYIFLVLALALSGGQPAFAQEKPVTELQGPTSSEPFSITSGSSFTASSNSPNARRKAAAVLPETIERDVAEALAIIGGNHVSGKQLDRDQLSAKAITGMLKTLDPHSTFYPTEEFQALLGEYESEYSGTGSSIAGFVRNGQLEIYVLSTFAGSPAEKSGLQFGDRIVAVNGRAIAGLSPDSVRDLIRGKTGSIVRLTIEKATDLKTVNIEIRRDRVHEPSVPKGAILRGKIGYIDISNGFGNTTYIEFDAALRDLKGRGITSVMIDLRGNRGGILTQAIKVAERFLPGGVTIVTQRGRSFADEKTWRANAARPENMPLVVLVNERSASASEVVAGALQDNDRAMIVGQKTFGKGLVQNVLHLPGGAGLTLTAARYYTPAGRSIQRDYETTSLYDYYHHRNRTAEIGRSAFAARTPTNRVVYGGDGITPDELVPTEPMTELRFALLDPIFFFSRDYLNGRIETNDGKTPGAKEIRQKILFGEEIVDIGIEKAFSEFSKGHLDPSIAGSLANEAGFVRRMLTYFLALGAFGRDEAERTRIALDPVISLAADAIPRAASLASEAEAARVRQRKQKRPSSLVLNGPR
ncbi:MAG TPA: S41 family peptidase [Pyrinomonadaceae bacterium]|nr:S41 family peptidase [Pyrinomonadaceae bacterium]